MCYKTGQFYLLTTGGPIEKLWKNTKKEATHLRYFKAFDELRASVLKAFRTYLEDATRVIRVMKKLRAQAGLV